MSYTYLQEQGEEYSAEFFSDIPAYVLLRLNLTAEKFCSKGSEMDACQSSPSGMTCEHSTENHGAEKSILSVVDSLVKTSVRQGKERDCQENVADYGVRWHALPMKFDLLLSSWRTHLCLFDEDLQLSSVILPKWGMLRDGELYRRLAPACITKGRGFGFWPTPTKFDGKNQNMMPRNGDTTRQDKFGKQRKVLRDGRTASMGLCRLIVSLTGRLPNPETFEELMGWPNGWTALNQLEMDKFHKWLNLHGNCSDEESQDPIRTGWVGRDGLP